MSNQPLKKSVKKAPSTPKATTRAKSALQVKPKFDFEGLMSCLVVMTLTLILVCTWFIDLSDGVIDPANQIFYAPLVAALGGAAVYLNQQKTNKDNQVK